jgi:hypothetical protein
MGGPPSFDITVRWESAEPVRQARKDSAAAPEGEYLISVSGFPVGGGRGRGFGGPQPQLFQEPDAPRQPEPGDMTSRIQESAELDIKGKPPLHPKSVERMQTEEQAILLHFDRSELPITPSTKEVAFSMRLGPLSIKAKFSVKDMLYKEQLAL